MKHSSKHTLTYWIWALGDIEVLNAITTDYAKGHDRSRTRLAFLFTVSTILTAIFAVATWSWDIMPTKEFVFEVAHRVAPNVVTTATMVAWSLFVLSLLPNLLEFGAAGLAIRGSIAVEVLMLLSLLFDMGTDAPNAIYWSGVLLDVLLGHYPALPVWMGLLLRWAIAIPLLFVFTMGVEIAFMTFALATWRLGLAYVLGERVHRAERAARRSRHTRARPARHHDPHHQEDGGFDFEAEVHTM